MFLYLDYSFLKAKSSMTSSQKSITKAVIKIMFKRTSIPLWLTYFFIFNRTAWSFLPLKCLFSLFFVVPLLWLRTFLLQSQVIWQPILLRFNLSCQVVLPEFHFKMICIIFLSLAQKCFMANSYLEQTVFHPFSTVTWEGRVLISWSSRKIIGSWIQRLFSFLLQF